MFYPSERVHKLKITQHIAFFLGTENNTLTLCHCNCGKGRCLVWYTNPLLCFWFSVDICDWQKIEQPWSTCGEGCLVATVGTCDLASAVYTIHKT